MNQIFLQINCKGQFYEMDIETVESDYAAHL